MTPLLHRSIEALIIRDAKPTGFVARANVIGSLVPGRGSMGATNASLEDSL